MRNRDIAELLSREAEHADGHLRRAFRRAARRAFLWPVEATTLMAAGRSLTELSGVGPYLARRIREWIEGGGEAPAPPPLRQDFLTLTAAEEILARDPSWRSALRGDLQMHTAWSDGATSVLAMAEAASALGHQYVAITDHSKKLAIAHGLDETRLLAQESEIADVNRALAASGVELRVLRALEMNLAPDGSGDMEPAALARLDLVLGAFHSALRRREDQTERYLAGLANPDIQILAHPRGRIYDFRAGLAADWPRVFARAAELDKAVEIDAYPDRQDLNGELLVQARAAGVRISIGSDAHHPRELPVIVLGLAAALAAGIPRDRIVNFMAVPDLLAWVAAARGAGPISP